MTKSFPAALLLCASLLFLAMGCEDDEMPGTGMMDEVIEGPFDPIDFTLDIPTYLPGPILNPDNPLTEEGIQLGRKLFYDPIFSRDSSMSCSSCHLQSLAFTDGLAKSVGIAGLEGPRNAMSPVNMVFNATGFNWDGSSTTIEDQAIHPVTNALELDNDWEIVLERLRRHPTYPRDFRAAFGIGLTSELTRDLAVKAIAQFERTLISANSRYDQVVYRNEGFFTELEEEGRELYFIEFIQQGVLHPGCSHCHNAPNFGDNLFHNNGLDSVGALTDFVDLGRGGENNNVFDNGKFRTPTLRNIELTAPYMHDGRFNTLEEVVQHYAEGGHGVENENANITGFELTPRKQAALVAFMKTLTDESFINDPRFASPF
ncbi:MAG: cytochrome c peroxidase [Bacteroidota bacterium]